MKQKISELESKGIHPDRSNVQPHLNNIKMFATSGWQLSEDTVTEAKRGHTNVISGTKASQRPERAPIKLDNSFLPKPPTQVKHRFSTPPRSFVRQFPQKQSKPILRQQVLQRKDGLQRPPVNVNVNKIKAVTDLESEIGEVIDGLTELAERFPEDFTSLMDTFHKPRQPHGAVNKGISPMDILNLANMITQVHCLPLAI